MKKIYTFKATMLGCCGTSVRGRKPYRVFEISGGDSLHKLAELIIDSFDFMLDHCFGFYHTPTKYWQDADEIYTIFADLNEDPDEFEGKSIKKTKISSVFIEGKKMLFLFDYGDEWEFSIECTKIAPAVTGVKYPQITVSKGEAPQQYPEWEDEEEIA